MNVLTEEEIFAIALQKPRAERAAYLDGACQGDTLLRSSVEALLAAHDVPDSFLDTPVGESPIGEGTLDQPLIERPGTKIGPYKLLEQIGEGGFGVVFMAEQTQPLRRRVALKVIKPGMDSRQVIARFEAERQALSLMDHPNIAKVLDAGTTQSGRPYFVMELVKGQPITQYCDEQHLTPRQRLELLLPVCQAIQHAHQKGIIHRDVKPSNILVAEYDQQPVPKVIDFGVAKAISQSLTEKTMFTGLGQIVGTLEYMSPEQAKVNQLDIDTRSDIYSLGVLLYELLTGSTPFDKQRLRSAGWDEMLRIIREEEPPKPSTKLSSSEALPSVAANRSMEPARLSRSVRGELDWIVMKALEKDRNRRYETANGLAMDLQRYLADEPVLACPPSAGYRLQKFVQRNKSGIAVAALVLFVLVLVGISVGWAVRDRAATAQQIAAQRAERQAKREQTILQALDEIEFHYRGGQNAEAMATVRHAESVQADGEISEELKERVARWRADLELVARLEKIRLERATLSEDGKWDWSAADRAYQQTFRQYGLDMEAGNLEDLIQRMAKVRIAVELAVALDDWVNLRRQLPNVDEASWRPLIVAAQTADPDPLRNRLRSLWGRKIDETRGEIEQLAASLPGQNLQPTTVVLVASVLKKAGLTAEAENVLREGQERNPGDFWINFELAYLLGSQPWAKAVDSPGFYRAAVAARPGNALVRSNLGFALARLSRPAEAERARREAIRLSPKYGYAHAGLGNLFRDQGKWEQAIAAYEDAIRAESNYTFPRSELVKILTNCPEAGLRDYRRALEVATEAAQLAPSSTWELQNLGWAEYRMGHWQAAIDVLEKSCQLQNNGGLGDAYQWFFLAMANQQLGRTNEARRWYDKSFEHTEIWNDEVRRIEAEAAELLGLASPPDQFFTSLAEARAHREAKRWQESIDAYSQAINLAPVQAAITWRSRGEAYLETKQWEPAVHDFTKSLEIAPQHHWVWHFRGRALAGLQQFDRAIADFTRAIEIKPQDWGALGNRGLAHIKLDHLDEAITDFTAALALAPGRAWLLEGRGKVHAKRGAWEQALADYARAVQSEPSADWVWGPYFAACAQSGQWDQAAAECDRALAALPPSKSPWQQNAKLFDFAVGRDEIYQRLCKLRPTDRALRIARVKHLIRQGAGLQSNSALAELIDLDPADHRSWYVAAILHLEAEAVDDYRRVCREMLRRFDRTPDPFVAERTAKSCFLAPSAVEDLATAQQLAQRASAVHSANHRFHLAQALGEYRAGNYERSLEHLQTSLSPEKESPSLAKTAWLIRSMAEHQLQRPADAHNSFAKAQELIDQGPQPDNSLLTDAWADSQCLHLLHQESGALLAAGQVREKAFVLARVSPAKEQSYFTLAAAVASAKDGDTIEIRGNGPFISRPIAIGERRLTIRAGEGFRPVLKFGVNGDANKGALLAARAALVLEGLEIHDGGLAEPAPRYPSAVFADTAPLYVANCRFVVKDQRAVYFFGGPSCQVRNCEFLGKPLLTFRCDAGQRLVIDNNLLPRSADVPIIAVWPPCKDVSLRLTRNSLHGNAAIQFYFFQTPLRATPSDQESVAPVQIETAGNIFDNFQFGTQFGFDLADGIQPEEAKAGLRRIVDWNQQGDLFALRGGAPAAKIRANQSSGERFTAANIYGLQDWTQFWGLPADVVIGGKVQYEGADLPRRAEASPEQLTPEDFRLREGSAGYRAGPDGKDLGPDIDIVGPGAGYERWKQTAEYQEWRRDTGQAK
jgi:serine/threonine protein kinase/Flp pilus assembly protein TadD